MDKVKEYAEKAEKGCTDQSKKSGGTLQEVFKSFSQLGGGKDSDGGNISLQNVEKWMQQANLVGEDKCIKHDDLAGTFSKIAKSKEHMNINEFQQFVEQLAKDKKMNAKTLMDKLTSCAGGTARGVAGNLEKMTGTSMLSGGGFQEVFKNFSQSGGKDSDGGTISFQSVEKWMKQANLLGEDKSIKSVDLKSAFSKIAKSKEHINMNEFQQLVQQLAKDGKMNAKNIMDKLSSCTGHVGGGISSTMDRVSGTVGSTVGSLFGRGKKEGGHGQGTEEDKQVGQQEVKQVGQQDVKQVGQQEVKQVGQQEDKQVGQQEDKQFGQQEDKQFGQPEDKQVGQQEDKPDASS